MTELPPDPAAQTCPFRDALADFTGSWSSQVLNALKPDKLRFSELQRTVVPISKRMLSKTLRALEADGLIERHVYPTKPLRVEYELTKLGRSFLEHLNGMEAWAEENRNEISSFRQKFMLDQG